MVSLAIVDDNNAFGRSIWCVVRCFDYSVLLGSIQILL